jgi:hypothetical protein
MNTIENNKLIAEFMGCYQNNEGFWGFENTPNHKRWHTDRFLDCTKYDTDWNWLMLVVEKISNTKRSKWSPNTYPCVKITGRGCKISFYGNYEKVITDIIRPNRIKAVYDACIEFIKWYNQQK